MLLKSPRFFGFLELQRIYEGQGQLERGSKGDAVRAIQEALLTLGYSMPVTTLKGKSPPDGVYGSETILTIKDIQFRYGLQPMDGILGQDEMALFDRLFEPVNPPSNAQSHHCGNCYNEAGNAPNLSSLQNQNSSANGHANSNGQHPFLNRVGTELKEAGGHIRNKVAAVKQKVIKVAKPIIAGLKAIDIPNTITPLEDFLDYDPSWLDAVDQTFGASLDYRNIFVNNGLGFDGRQFVMFLPVPGFLRHRLPTQARGILLMQMGPYHALTTNILLHELMHCWQSQHVPEQARFMRNAIASQRAGSKHGGSAYAYQYAPMKKFEEYGAEQLAQMIENGEQSIIDHVRSLKAWEIDPALETSLSTPKWDDARRAGVTE